MDLKQEMMYRDDTLLVKTEPRLHSPCATSSNGLSNTNLLVNVSSTGIPANGLTTSLAIVTGNTSAITSSNGLNVSVPSNGLGGNSSYGTVGTSSNSNKRPRTEEWLSSPSPGAISVSVPPLTPSPGPPNQQYTTVISNGYSSPMSSGGSYDPYSPNGKIGEFLNFLDVLVLRFYLSPQHNNVDVGIG